MKQLPRMIIEVFAMTLFVVAVALWLLMGVGPVG